MLRVLGKLRNYQVKLYPNNSVKPAAVPPRSVPYHFKVKVSDAIDNMLKEGVIEKHSIKDPSPWVSCAIIVPKTDGFSRITLDAQCKQGDYLYQSSHAQTRGHEGSIGWGNIL